MDELYKFLDLNLNGVQSDHSNNEYKEGVFGIYYLENTDTSIMDPITRARFLYIKNLCLNDAIEFEVPENLSHLERALMFLSFNSIGCALNILNMGIQCEVIGTEARTRTGSIINVAVLKTSNTVLSECLDYTAQGYSYEDFKIQPLTVEELTFIYIKMMDIYKNEDNKTLKRFKLNAYLHRVMGKENAQNDSLMRAFLVLDAAINNSIDDLDKFKDSSMHISEDLFKLPITFKFDMMIHLGLALKSRFFYTEAYQTLLPYPMHIEKIDCLIAMRKSQEAVNEISAYIASIGEPKNRADRMILCDLFIKLGHLYQDPKYYDMAANVFKCAKPYHVKGLFHFNRKEYELAAQSFEQALSVTPQDEKIRFSYGCALVELERISEALKVFQTLKIENAMNDQIAKNLSDCYYKENDIENSLKTLKSVALSDPSSMNQFFLISIKNEKLDNVKWALSKMNSIDYIRGSIHYLHSNNLIPVEELKQLIESNQYVDRATFDSIFS